ncbi:MAG: biotin-dependent carboxyltransferase family protein [Stenotrophomonas sp.]
MTSAETAGCIKVLSPGLLTTVQDEGRVGLRHLGVAVSGAADAWSHALANLLVGNARQQATLEITLTGPTLHFSRASRIALCGARIDASLDGQPLPGYRPITVPAGSTLQLGPCRDGARSYLAVAGGMDVPEVLGSRSTDLRGGFGGYNGRALKAGDVLPLHADAAAPDDALRIPAWWIDGNAAASPTGNDDPLTIRLLPGTDMADGLFDAIWQVDNRSNRQGLRLQGPQLQVRDQRERVSEPVSAGVLQLPGEGQPIALLADAQTHGGYPRIGHVIRADLSLLAQLRPGCTLQFRACSAEQARQAANEQRHRLYRIGQAIAARTLSA